MAKTGVPQSIEPTCALQPGAKQASWREDARKKVNIQRNDDEAQ